MLSLALLGAVELTADEVALDPPRSRNARTLLAMLALERGPLSRELLADRLWPDKPGRSARDSLNTELANLRRALGDHGGRLARYRTNLALVGDDIWVDAREFDDAYNAGDASKALALWRGPFMQDTGGAWVWQHRERYRSRMARLLANAADSAQELGDMVAAVDLSRRWVEIAEEDERAAALLIARLVQIGDGGGANREFERHARVLAERGRAPGMAVTRALSGELGPTAGRSQRPMRKQKGGSRSATESGLTASPVDSSRPLSTGLPDLDRCIGGLPIGLTLVASRPRVGATALVTRILLNAVTRLEVPSILFATDLPEAECAMRFVAAVARVDLDQLRNGRVPESSWPQVLSASQRLAQAPLYVDDSPDLTIEDVEARVAESALGEAHRGLVLIDDLQGMSVPPDTGPQVLARLRRLARARNLALLITTQVNPRVGHRADKRPALGDIPAYDPLQVRPDLVLGLYREEMDYPDTDRPAELDILIEQNRRGPVGEVTVVLIAGRGTVLPLALPESEDPKKLDVSHSAV